MRPTAILIDKAACAHNLSELRKLAPRSKFLAMIKANAYGHGVDLLMPALQLADALGVCSLEEALQLRKLNFVKGIVLMQGFFDAEELHAISRNDLTCVIHNAQQIALIKKTALKRPLKIWLKLDSGMHRLGFLPAEFHQVYQTIKSIDQIHQQALVIMSHFACADESHGLNNTQQQAFQKILTSIDEAKSFCNSAALFQLKSAHYDWIRVGLAMYGISPFNDIAAANLNLKPVMTFKSQLIAVKNVPAGEYVGYGAKWRCPESMPVGIVTAGYADGYPRHAGSGTPVLVKGQRTQLIGRVSMDSLNIDLRPIHNPQIGDEVILWGSALPIEIIAQHAKTIPYELVTKINQRVRRILQD